MKTIYRLILILSSGVTLFTFQNCSDAQFSNLDAPTISKKSNDGATVEEITRSTNSDSNIDGSNSAIVENDDLAIIEDSNIEDSDITVIEDSNIDIIDQPEPIPQISAENTSAEDDTNNAIDTNTSNSSEDSGDDEDSEDNEDKKNRNLCSLSTNEIYGSTLKIKIKEAFLGGGNGAEVSVHTFSNQLLQLSNGEIVITTNLNIDANQLRLVLEDSGNEIISPSGEAFPLTTPSGQQSGIKINLEQSHNSAPSVNFGDLKTYTVNFGIDLGKQIVQTGNGRCIFKPVLHATNIAVLE